MRACTSSPQGAPFLNLSLFNLDVGKQLIYLLLLYSQVLFQPLSLFIFEFFDILEKGETDHFTGGKSVKGWGES